MCSVTSRRLKMTLLNSFMILIELVVYGIFIIFKKKWGKNLYITALIGTLVLLVSESVVCYFATFGSVFYLIIQALINLLFVFFFFYVSFKNQDEFFDIFLSEIKIPIFASLIFSAIIYVCYKESISNYILSIIDVSEHDVAFPSVLFIIRFMVSLVLETILFCKVLYDISKDMKHQIIHLIFTSLILSYFLNYVLFVLYVLLFLMEKFVFKNKNFSVIYTFSFGLKFVISSFSNFNFQIALIALLAIVLIQGSVMLVNKLKNKKRVALVEAKEIKTEVN